MSADLPNVRRNPSPQELIARKLPTAHREAWAREIVDELMAHGYRIVDGFAPLPAPSPREEER